MAQGLMGLQDLLGQSSNAQQQSGLLGGGVFSQPESRGRRRSRLLNDAIAGAGQNPYARLGASLGGLIGMGGRAAGEGLGILDKPEEVQQQDAIRQVQQEVADRGLDPMSNPREFGDFVAGRFQELNQPQLATRSLLQARQIEREFAPEEKEGVLRVVGGTEQAQQAAQLYPGLGIDSLGEGESATISLTGNRATGIEVDSTSPTKTQKANLIDPDSGDVVAGSFNPLTEEYSIGGEVVENARPAPGTPLVDMGESADSEFNERFARLDAETLSQAGEVGAKAVRNRGRLDRLDQLLKDSPQGFEGGVKQIAGQFGIATEGVDEIQATQALVNSIVPEQRPEGSGPMSDADLQFFIESFPRIINQKGGNEKIINTLRAINEYDAQAAEIVGRLRRDEIDRAKAFDQLRERENPLSSIQDDIDQGTYTVETPKGTFEFDTKGQADSFRKDAGIE